MENREKQIEEMADILCEAKGHDCNGGDDCRCVKQAEALYNAGYRKASEVAEEIFAEIEEHIMLEFNEVAYAELKKKYTEIEKDDGQK